MSDLFKKIINQINEVINTIIKTMKVTIKLVLLSTSAFLLLVILLFENVSDKHVLLFVQLDDNPIFYVCVVGYFMLRGQPLWGHLLFKIIKRKEY